jgi:hypothetical protein
MLSFFGPYLLFLHPCRESKHLFVLVVISGFFETQLFRARELKAEALRRLGDKTGEIWEEICPSFLISFHTHRERGTKKKRRDYPWFGERIFKKQKLFKRLIQQALFKWFYYWEGSLPFLFFLIYDKDREGREKRKN